MRRWGWTPPHLGHLSLVLDEDRKKLSKRRGATSCHEFKLEGFLPEALKNYIVLLGWSHPEAKEILSEEELIAAFAVERLHSAGAIFDIAKLRWMNAHHLRAKSNDEIWQLLQPFLAKENLQLPDDLEWRRHSVEIFKTSMETLTDGVELYRLISDGHFALLPESHEVLAWPSTPVVLQAWRELVAQESADRMTEARFVVLQDQVKEKAQVKGKFLFQAIRVAVIGRPHGTELKILVPLLQKTSLLKRVDQVLAQIRDAPMAVVTSKG